MDKNWTDDNPADITVTIYENNVEYAENTYVLHGAGSKVSTMRIEILVANDAAQGSGSFVVTFYGSDTGAD